MKYQVKIAPLSPRNQSRVAIHLTRILGQGAQNAIKDLVKNGGVVRDDLSKAEADRIGSQLRNLGAVVEVNQAKPEEPEEGYRLKLISAGKRKIAVIKEVRALTGLGLKKAKLLVDNLEVIGVFEDENDAYGGKQKLESVGAIAIVEQIDGSGPEPEPQPKPSSDKDEEPVPHDISKKFYVFGRVHSHSDSPLTGLIVRAFDRDIRSEKTLGESRTDKKGSYRIEYKATQLRNQAKEKADLIIRVYNPVDTLLTESNIYFNVNSEQEINITIPENININPSKYEVLVSNLKPLHNGLAHSELNSEDVFYLSNKTGYPSSEIKLLVVSARLSEITDLSKTIFWGIGISNPDILKAVEKFSLNENNNAPEVFITYLNELEQVKMISVLESTVSDNIIPALSQNELDSIKEKLAEIIYPTT